MKLLKDRILKDGQAIGTSIIKVDSFLNHQLDVALIDKMGEELYNRFKEKPISKILTIEASGIAIACMTANYFKVPVVFAKKSKPSTLIEGSHTAEVKSFTKNITSLVSVSEKYINKEDKVLIIDDFLAHGEALRGLIEIVEKANATVLGAGIAIEKRFQNGGEALRDKGVQIESLAIIESINNGKIVFL